MVLLIVSILFYSPWHSRLFDADLLQSFPALCPWQSPVNQAGNKTKMRPQRKSASQGKDIFVSKSAIRAMRG